jgi:hypothetical protein
MVSVDQSDLEQLDRMERAKVMRPRGKRGMLHTDVSSTAYPVRHFPLNGDRLVDESFARHPVRYRLNGISFSLLADQCFCIRSGVALKNS